MKKTFKFALQIVIGMAIIFCLFSLMSIIDVQRGFYKQFENPIKGGVER
jgi:hypothetical protein